MKQRVILTVLFHAGSARAGTQTQARRLELRAGLQEGKRRRKQVTLDQHKELLLVRERERLALRARGREQRIRLRKALKDEHERIVVLRYKK